MSRFVKDVDAALMRPGATLRAVQITTGFFENILNSFENPQNIISDQNIPIWQGSGCGPNTAWCGPPRCPNYDWFLPEYFEQFRKLKFQYFWSKQPNLPRQWMRPWCGPMRPSERSNCFISALVPWGPHQGRIHFSIPDKIWLREICTFEPLGKKLRKSKMKIRKIIAPAFVRNWKTRNFEFFNSGQTLER